MAQPSFIPRQAPHDDPDSVASLLRAGLEQVQRLSGNRWTDYNLHDPGVTLLELLCFALTDLIYRTDFEVADYLTQPDGRLDFAAQGLMLPEQIFPPRPCTRQDYQQALLDAMDEVEQAWVTPDGQGRYHIDLLLTEAARQRCDHHPALRDDIVDAAAHLYHRDRNLGEDLAGVRIIDSRGLRLHADIELHYYDNTNNLHDNADNLAAEIYFQAEQWLRGDETDNHTESYADHYADHRADSYSDNSPDNYTDTHGAPGNERVAAARPLSALYTRLINIDGVGHIRQLQLIPQPGRDDHPDNAPDLFSPGDWILLPKKHDDIDLNLTHQGHPLSIDFSAMSIRLVRRQAQNDTLREQIRRQTAALTPPPRGIWRALADYRSIQSLFPGVYRLDAPRVPATLNRQERAQIQQFRGYLLLFEQLMANFCANLTNLRDLFSPATDAGRSYAFNLLDDEQFRGVDLLYPDDAAARFHHLLADVDHYPDRKGRLLDYLLALYGETLDARLWRQPGEAPDDRVQGRQQLEYRRRFIQAIDRLTRDRGAGFNTRRPMTERENRGGFTDRVALLLGMDDADTWPYSQTLARQGWQLIADDAFLHSAAGQSHLQWLDQPALDSLLDVPLNDAPPPGSADAAARDVLALRLRPLPVDLLQRGVMLEHYRILPPDVSGFYQALFRLSAAPGSQNGLWLHLGASSQPAHLVRVINQLRRELIRLNQRCEGVYVVEHLLLRPAHGGDDARADSDPFPGQISLILPGYTARGGNPVFRAQADALIAQQCPAHLLPRCHWLDIRATVEFETAWLAWLDARREAPGQPSCDDAAARLTALLQSLHAPQKKGQDA
ncbi:hypothetical protein [Dickeya fangzhongdai]|uniref:hypothetical protein n=1 Tax=Dickeya fangzhongdai TaxID=1778540 RepID=UPI0026E0759D|nr:hypothetical protein [Dickeya fangzhongdai]WKV49777.1 hypothetical protein PL145_17925 [Dickeya fangzhongdai]